MTVVISGTAGIQNVLGSAAAPSNTNVTSTNTGVYFPTSTTLGIATAGVNAVTVDASQNVGIGTSSPLQKLQVKTQTNGNAAFQNSTSVAGGVKINCFNDAGSASSPFEIDGSTLQFNIASTEKMRIDTSGGLILAGSTAQKATGTTWSNPSDQRLKNNIRDYTKGTTELMQVRVREWEYNGKGGTTEGTKGLGVVADEIITVLPNTVENYEAKLNSEDEEITAIKKFDATEITWLLVKTVQEQQALITSLTARIEALEAK